MMTMMFQSPLALAALSLLLVSSSTTTQAFAPSSFSKPAATRSSNGVAFMPPSTTTSTTFRTSTTFTTTRSTKLYMGWGPDPVWSQATVTSTESACASDASVLVKLSVPAETAAAYTLAGQYVQVRLDDSEDSKPLFLAIASAPDPENAEFEFLIKKVDGNEWMTTSITTGATVQVSQVLGGGYAVEENLDSLKFDFPTQNVLLFAAGSGISPIKAALESGVGGSRTAKVYYGERTEADLCYTDKFAEWTKAGYEIIPVLSQPGDDWKGRTGYVQNALEEDGIDVPRNSGALLCGMKGMTESVKDLLTKAGVFEGRVLFNF